MELKYRRQALQGFAKPQPNMTEDETSEMIGVQRPIISRFGSDCARYEHPSHGIDLRSGQRWTAPYCTGAAS